MDGLKQRLVTATVLVTLLVAGGAQLSLAKNLGDDRNNRIEGSTLPLNSMVGLELQGISEAGAEPVKIKSEVASYRGRRAVRIVNDDGPAGGVSGGQVLAIV